MPTRKTTESKYAPTVWGNEESGMGVTREVTCPSGQVILCRRPGPEQLMLEGVINDLDTLTSIVDSELIPQAENGKKKAVDAKALAGNTDLLERMTHVMNRVACAVVVEPQVEYPPNDITRRKKNTIYADMISIEDRTFIMQFAMGGTADVETFRQEARARSGSVGAVEEDGEETE